MLTLHAHPGWGSAIVELQLAHYSMEFKLIDHGDMFASAEARAALAPLNPISQLPTVMLADGTVMTESAAITLLLADMAASDTLVPAPGDPTRAAFLRWLVFIVANIYPTFTYADDPSRFVKPEAARAGFRAEVDAHAQRLWAMVDHAAGDRWFLGERFSALDLYIGVMTRWRPRQDWFAANAKRLATIGDAARALPALLPVWERNFPAA
jgi:GST-like protein